MLKDVDEIHNMDEGKDRLTTLNDASQAFLMKFDNMENFEDMYEHWNNKIMDENNFIL